MEKQMAEQKHKSDKKVDPTLKKVIFVCTGNSARSQMAEAIVTARLGAKWKAYSAGTQPADYVHPHAIQVLKEMGIEHDGRTKTVDGFFDCDFDLVVTVCDNAAEKCPIWLGKGKRVHMGFPDPAKETGNQEQVLNVFRQVRDDIAHKIPELLSLYE